MYPTTVEYEFITYFPAYYYGIYRIACVSCPTLYSKLISIKPSHCQVTLLEYDRRFEKYGDDFVFYDYNNPLDIPDKLGQTTFDLVVADPPYLSEECFSKTAETVKFLSKDKILLCTGGAVVTDYVGGYYTHNSHLFY